MLMLPNRSTRLLSFCAPLLLAAGAWGQASSDDLAEWRKAAETMMAEGLENRQYHGAAIILAGEDVIFEAAVGYADVETGEKNTLDTLFRLCSLTKLFTQVGILQLVDDGVLDIDAKVSKYRPEFSRHIGDKISIRQLLQMTSGLPRELTDDSATSGVEFDDDGMAGPFLDDLDDLELVFKPGSRQSYSNVGYWLLGAIIEAVTDKTYADYIARAIFEPLGMERSGYSLGEIGGAGFATGHRRWHDDSLRHVAPFTVSQRYSSGALHSSPREMVLFLQSFATGELLSAESLDLMFTGFGYHSYNLTKAGGPMVQFMGHVPGFWNAAMHHIEEGYLVVFLNNCEITPPQSVFARPLNIIRVMRGDKPQPIPAPPRLNLKPLAKGFPKTPFARNVMRLVRAIGKQDGQEIHKVFLASNETTPGHEASNKQFCETLAGMVERLGGYDVFWEERDGGALFVLVCGAKGPETRFTFSPSTKDKKLIGDVSIENRE